MQVIELYICIYIFKQLPTFNVLRKYMVKKTIYLKVQIFLSFSEALPMQSFWKEDNYLYFWINCFLTIYIYIQYIYNIYLILCIYIIYDNILCICKYIYIYMYMYIYIYWWYMYIKRTYFSTEEFLFTGFVTIFVLHSFW